VIETVASVSSSFTVEDICAELPSVGRATVFRTVKLLQESGAICRLPLEDGRVLYQLSNGGHHHHLTCRNCGRVTEFSDHELDEGISASATRAGFELESHSVELFGRCSCCAERRSDT